MTAGYVFVFGSNLAGRHGKGAALEAQRHYGAIYGQGIGRQGMSYAIPTKDRDLKVLTLDAIERHVREFLDYAAANSTTEFFVTAIGTGLAGYRHEDIAPMFRSAPKNCALPVAWQAFT